MDHILIVEDDRALSQGIRLALDQAGRQFTQCHTLREAEEALAILKAQGEEPVVLGEIVRGDEKVVLA